MNTTFSTNRLGGVTFKGTGSSTLNEIWLSGRHYEVLEYTSEKQTIDQYNAALRSIGSGYHLEPSDDDSGSKEAVVADSILSNYSVDSSDNVDIDYNELREILIDIQGLMRSISKDIIVYNFDELSKDVQGQVIERYLDSLQDYEYTEDGRIFS